MNIHLINLDRSPDRLATFQAVNSHIVPNIERVSAIDGKHVERTTLIERGIIAADLKYNESTLGCALSHIALWDMAIREGRTLTICEDDAIFNHSFCAASEAILPELPPDWHVILWGWNFDSMLWFYLIPGVSDCIGWFDQKSLRKGIDAFQSASLCPRSFRLFQAFGTVCYSISSTGAQLLRQNCLPLRNTSVYIRGLKAYVLNYSFDVALNGAYGHLNSFVSIPPLVVTTNEHKISTIRADAISPTAARLLRAVSRLRRRLSPIVSKFGN